MYKKFVLLKYVIILLSVSQICIAQDAIDVRRELSGKEIKIYYKIHADSGTVFDINVFLRKENDVEFEYQLKNVSGDIGTGKFASTEKLIVWQYSQKEKEMFRGDDFYFEIRATKITEGIPWYYYVGGGAIAGIIAYLLCDEPTKEELIPSPPERP